MKKKRTPFLPDPVFTFDDTAVVMMRTNDQAFQLAILLNEAYDLQFSRIDDIYINDTLYPCFLYHDEPAWLVYILIARPSTGEAFPAFANYDKMLLVRGRDSWSFQQTLYDNMRDRRYGNALGTAAEPDPTDLLAHAQWEQLNRLSANLPSIDIFGFSNRRGAFSTLRLAEPEPTLFPVDHPATNSTENRAIADYHKLLQAFLLQTFEALNIHLCDEDYTSI